MESVNKEENQMKEEVVNKEENQMKEEVVNSLSSSSTPRENFGIRKNIILRRISIDESPRKINIVEKPVLIDEFTKILLFASFLILIICTFVVIYSRSKLKSQIPNPKSQINN